MENAQIATSFCIDCVFQPVSSNSGTAFIPVLCRPGRRAAWNSALRRLRATTTCGRGTEWRSAVWCSSSSASSGLPPPYRVSNQSVPAAGRQGDYGRRRPRDDDPGMRLPPPLPYQQEEDPRRRSPASTQSGSTPPTGYHQYQQGHYDDRMSGPQRNSPGGPSAQPPPPGSNGNPMSLDNMMGPRAKTRGEQ